jgi:uncharacterized membrane protein YhaH (DUF805 family)
MFKNPFSFEGRIRRTEYGVSIIIYAVASVIINGVIVESRNAGILGLAFIPMLWFLWAQGAKRCHDVGNSGWWQIIPLYGLWLLFQDGQPGNNQFGENPKGILVINGQTYHADQSEVTTGSDGYQGGYSGGHNGINSNFSTKENSSNTMGYQNGDLYK